MSYVSEQPPQFAGVPQQSTGLSTGWKFFIGFLVLLLLTFVGLFTWQTILNKQLAPDSTTPPPPPPPLETAEQKAAREAKEAADKAAALNADQTTKEQASLDADVSSAANRITNMPYEVQQTKQAFIDYNAKIATLGAKPETVAAETKAALINFATQRERALASAGWGSNLASAIEKRAKVLKKDTDAAVSKAIADLRSGSDAAFAALAGDDAGVALFKDSNGCVGHMTKDLGIVNCPAKFNTFYSYGVNVAGDCPDKDGLCNRCTGFEFPKPAGGRDGQWNSSQWAAHSGKATAPAKSGEGKVMSYSGIYVVDGQPQAYEKC